MSPRRSVRLKAKVNLDGSPSRKNNNDFSEIRPKSPQNCSICLGKMEDRSFTDTCAHEFCFVCLCEWSKVKAECPLCKRKFKKISHNIRSYSDYDEYVVPIPERTMPHFEDRFRVLLDGFTTTYEFVAPPYIMNNNYSFHPIPTIPTSLYQQSFNSFNRRRRQASIAEFRRRIYERGCRVKSFRRSSRINPRRRRECSPTFFRENSAQVHRLAGWLRRELIALMTPQNSNAEDYSLIINELMTNVLEAVTRYRIKSSEMRDIFISHLGDRTDHFLHEFEFYARSPFDLLSHDRYSLYEENEDSNNSVIVLDDNESSRTRSRSRNRDRMRRRSRNYRNTLNIASCSWDSSSESEPEVFNLFHLNRENEPNLISISSDSDDEIQITDDDHISSPQRSNNSKNSNSKKLNLDTSNRNNISTLSNNFNNTDIYPIDITPDLTSSEPMNVFSIDMEEYVEPKTVKADNDKEISIISTKNPIIVIESDEEKENKIKPIEKLDDHPILIVDDEEITDVTLNLNEKNSYRKKFKKSFSEGLLKNNVRTYKSDGTVSDSTELTNWFSEIDRVDKQSRETSRRSSIDDSCHKRSISDDNVESPKKKKKKQGSLKRSSTSTLNRTVFNDDIDLIVWKSTNFLKKRKENEKNEFHYILMTDDEDDEYLERAKALSRVSNDIKKKNKIYEKDENASTSGSSSSYNDSIQNNEITN